MKYVKYTLYAPYSGTEQDGYLKFEDTASTAFIEDCLDDMSYDYAESYEHLVTGWNDDIFEDEDEREAALEFYYEDRDFEYHFVSEEEYREYN